MLNTITLMVFSFFAQAPIQDRIEAHASTAFTVTKLKYMLKVKPCTQALSCIMAVLGDLGVPLTELNKPQHGFVTLECRLNLLLLSHVLNLKIVIVGHGAAI